MDLIVRNPDLRMDSLLWRDSGDVFLGNKIDLVGFYQAVELRMPNEKIVDKFI